MTDKTFGTQPADERIIQKMIDMGDGTYALQTVSHPPFDMLTDGGDGAYRRLRVDVGQTGFFAGREFKIFREFNLSTGVSEVLKIVCPVNVIFQYVGMTIWEGNARFEILEEGGTEGGTFDTPLLPIRTNRMSTADLTYNGQVTIATGGTYIDSAINEAVQLNSGTGSGTHNEIADDNRPYGLAIGTYYVKITAIGGTAKGSVRLRWEERV